MPLVSQSGYGNNVLGIQKYRHDKAYDMTAPLKAAWPWPGGKSVVAAQIWARLGDVPNLVEPFCGTAALTLARPHDLEGKTESLNDADGFVCNALRAIAYDPEETAHWCDWPVSEIDLTAVHLWLKAQRDDLTARLFADPDYCDPKAAGRWLWGIASWIGDGWCVADGPWIAVDGKLVDRRTLPEDERGEGVRKKMPALQASENSPVKPAGILSLSYRAAPGVPRKMPEIGRSPNGQMDFNRKGVRAYLHRDGVPKQMPWVSANDKGSSGKAGVNREAFYPPGALLAYFERLAVRLRRVRLLCGDWRRAVKDSVTVNHGTTGVYLHPTDAIFLDPPYPSAEHDMRYHGNNDVWHDAAAWAIEHGDDPRLRICIAGYYTPEIDQLFPATWERLSWEARGGYANQKADGRGRENAKREMLWFSKHCVNPATDYTGTLFEGL